MSLRIGYLAAVASLSLCGAAGDSRADERSKGVDWIQAVVDEQTVAVIGLRLDRVDWQASAGWMEASFPGVPQRLAEEWDSTGRMIEILQGVGVSQVYAVFSFSDSFSSLPFFVLPEATETQAAVALEALEPLYRDRYVATPLDGFWVIGSSATASRLIETNEGSSDGLEAALDASADSVLQVAIRLNEDHWRAARELMPPLSERWGGLTWEHAAESVDWISVGLNPPPSLEASLIIESADEARAESLRSHLVAALARLADDERTASFWPEVALGVELLQPQRQGQRLTVRLESENASAALAGLRSPMRDWLRAGLRVRSVDDLKSIALAMHNYYDVWNRLPPYGSMDDQGRPLLSWRVHVLPFLDPELYAQFRLNEPWDSEHNRELIPRMPECFLSRESASRIEEGRSNVMVPTGPETMFSNTDGVEFSAVTDGLSNTIMLLEVRDDLAEVWTRPEPFYPDMSLPGYGLGGSYEDGFMTAFGDGRVRLVRTDVAPEVLEALLGREDGISVDPRDYELSGTATGVVSGVAR